MEYPILHKGFELGFSKQQTENIIKNQDEFENIKTSPLAIIAEYNGERKREVKADSFDNCDMIPDPKECSKDEKNIQILDDCFLGPQNKVDQTESKKTEELSKPTNSNQAFKFGIHSLLGD